MKDEKRASNRAPAIREMQTSGIAGFLQILRDMEEDGEREREISGNIVGPFFSRAKYSCMVRMGIDEEKPHPSSSCRSV